MSQAPWLASPRSWSAGRRAVGYRLARSTSAPQRMDRDVQASAGWLQDGNRAAARVPGFDRDPSRPARRRRRPRERLRNSRLAPLAQPPRAAQRASSVVPEELIDARGALGRPAPARPRGGCSSRTSRSPRRRAGSRSSTPSARDGEPDGRGVVVGGLDYGAGDRHGSRMTSARRRTARRSACPGPWPFLAGTLKEADGIARIWPRSGAVDLMEKAMASKTALQRALPRGQFVHLATHGFFADPGIRSVLDPAPGLDPADVGIRLNHSMNEREAQPDERLDVIGQNPLLLSGIACSGATGRRRSGRPACRRAPTAC